MNYFRLYVLLLPFFLLSTSSCYGSSSAEPSKTVMPWFTGPLLTPTAYVLPKGQNNIEPYLFWTITNGKYDKHWHPSSVKHDFYQLNPQLTYKVGLTEKLDFSGTIQSYSSWTQGVVGSSFGDLQIGFDYLLFNLGPPEELALGKIAIQETFPTGRYQHLNPHKHGTDVGGQGTFATQIGLAFSKQFKFQCDRFLRLRWFFASTFSTPVHVKGVSAFGGDACTKGTVHPGISYTFLHSVEYTMTRNWTIACDLQILYSDRNRFRGHSTTLPIAPQSIQFSLAPAIEYNWNEKIGVIVGPWFTFAGKSTKRFVSFVAALNYNF